MLRSQARERRRDRSRRPVLRVAGVGIHHRHHPRDRRRCPSGRVVYGREVSTAKGCCRGLLDLEVVTIVPALGLPARHDGLLVRPLDPPLVHRIGLAAPSWRHASEAARVTADVIREMAARIGFGPDSAGARGVSCPAESSAWLVNDWNPITFVIEAMRPLMMTGFDWPARRPMRNVLRERDSMSALPRV